MITGRPGAGKSVLLDIIMDSVVKQYDPSRVMIWTNYDCGKMNESIIEVTPAEDREHAPESFFIGRLFEEAENRLRIMGSQKVSFFYQTDSLPLLIAVMDDFCPFDWDTETYWQFMAILHMSQEVGISMICASQRPISEICGPSGADCFNMRIALPSSSERIYRTLDIYPGVATDNEKVAVEELAGGLFGDFILRDRYGENTLICGKVFQKQRA